MSDLRTWEAWREIHQPFELGWWNEQLAQGHSTDDAGFENTWREVREFIKPTGSVIDIGCGPRPPFAPCTVIEPLAEKYRQLPAVKTEWWDGVVAYAQPAEHLIPDLKADTIICWNCIDHLIGWREVLDNMLAYGNPQARFAIATDFWPPFIGHPGFEREEFMSEIDKRFAVIEKREPFGRAIGLLLTAKEMH